MEVGEVERQGHRLEVLADLRVAERVQAHADRGGTPGTTASPNASITQISALRSGNSSKPTIQSETIDRGDRMARARIPIQPSCGVQPHWVGCSSRTVWPSRNGCWPWVLPTGPDHDPDWIPETRIGGSWSPSHQTGWSTGIRDAGGVADLVCGGARRRELQAGR